MRVCVRGRRSARVSRIGNFVETKAATIEAGAKVNHLSYVGDASVGAGANLGAGTITCNYDGFSKHRTEIGEGAFVGTNSSLVAPVKIGKGAYIGVGLGDHSRRARGRDGDRTQPADRPRRRREALSRAEGARQRPLER